MSLRKYLAIIKISWQENLVYRLNFIMWRLRNIIWLVSSYLLWQAIFSTRDQVFGYDLNSITTYIIGTGVVGAIVFSSRTIDLGSVINSGDLSLYLLRPVNIFGLWFSRDIADKILNILFMMGEIFLIVTLFKAPFYFSSIDNTAIFLIAVLAALLIYFWINFLLGLLGFWFADVWAPRFVFMVMRYFMAGGFFPLDILPAPAFKMLKLTPFPYMQYFPIQIYLGRLGPKEIVNFFLITALWIVILFLITKKVWQLGLKTYTAEGH